jgi:hypothetical protein
MALQVAVMKAVLKEPGEQELVLRERDHTVSYVPGREHVEFIPQASGGPTIVGDGDDGGKVADETGKCWRQLFGVGVESEGG